MVKQSIRLITFDLDDTLWDMKPVLIAAEREVYRWLEQRCPALTTRYTIRELTQLRWQLAGEMDDLRHQISELRRATLAAVMEQAGLDSKSARQLSEQAFEVFLAARHQIELYEHAEECLQVLAADYTLGALTNGNADVFKLAIGRHFDFAYSAEQLNTSKPDPEHFTRALQHDDQASPWQAIHIGDDPEKDIAAAQRLGWHTIWVNKKGEKWPGEQLPSHSVSCLSQLVAAVQSIDSGS
jgi:putative hydrolase of the HAD superfamily